VAICYWDVGSFTEAVLILTQEIAGSMPDELLMNSDCCIADSLVQSVLSDGWTRLHVSGMSWRWINRQADWASDQGKQYETD
jgi:hypothetical protein